MMQQRQLGRTGISVSAVGLSISAPSAASDFRDTLAAAVDCGITLIHTTSDVDSAVGEALRGAHHAPLIHCVTLRYTGGNDYAAKRLIGAIDASLLRLRIERIDLLLCEVDRCVASQLEHETLPALLRMRDTGKLRALGVSGNRPATLESWASSSALDAMLVEGRFHLQNSTLQSMIPGVRKSGLGLLADDVLACGLFNDTIPAAHRAPQEVRSLVSRAAEYCRRCGTSLEKIAIQFALANSDIASALLTNARVPQIGSAARATKEAAERETIRHMLRILDPVHNVDW